MPIHPNKPKATRPRYEAAGGKSDGFDAFVLAELAPTDSHRHRALAPNSDKTKALRALTRTREDPGRRQSATGQRAASAAGCLLAGRGAGLRRRRQPDQTGLLGALPCPEDARRLGQKRLEGFLARNGYCGRRSGLELLERLRSAPAGRAGAMEAEARRGAVLGLVAALKPIVAQIRELTSQIAGAVRSHPDRQVFLPLF